MVNRSHHSVELFSTFLGVNSNLKLDNIKKTTNHIIYIQNEIAKNQTRLAEFQNKQLDIQEQQLNVQNQILLQQEIQTKIQQRNELIREKQKELKNVIFSIKSETSKALTFDDVLTRFILLQMINQDIIKNNISLSDFEEISDKEYAEQVLSSIPKHLQQTVESFTETDLKDLELLQTSGGKIKTLKNRISNRQSINYMFITQKVNDQMANEKYQKLIDGVLKEKNIKPIFIRDFINKLLDFIKSILQNRNEIRKQRISSFKEQNVLNEKEMGELKQLLETQNQIVDDFFFRHKDLTFLRQSIQ